MGFGNNDYEKAMRFCLLLFLLISKQALRHSGKQNKVAHDDSLPAGKHLTRKTCKTTTKAKD